MQNFKKHLSLTEHLRMTARNNHPEVFVGKGVLKICSKFTGEHPCRSAMSIKLQSKLIEITLGHGCSPKNLQHIFKTLFLKKTSGRLLLDCFFCLSVNFNMFFRTLFLESTSRNLLFYVQVAEFQPPDTVKIISQVLFKHVIQDREVAIPRFTRGCYLINNFDTFKLTGNSTTVS